MAISVNKLNIDCKTTVLSSRSAVYKTAELAAKLHRLNKSDFALGKIYEAVLALRAGSVATLSDGNGFYTASFGQRGEYEFSFATGALPAPLKRDDIIFYDFTGEGSEDLRLNDRRLETYLKDRSVFAAVLTPARTRPSGAAYEKLYRISGAERVDFPMLNAEQKAIVEAEDGNVLVQGVAGSGKTNLCIDKIVFAAARGYVGKVLYSTYSRGLLVDTQRRVNAFAADIENFVAEYAHGRVRFTDPDHKKAIENKLGIYFDVDEDDKIAAALTKTAVFLRDKVDYCLIEDLYRKYCGGKRRECGESYFLNEFVPKYAAQKAEGALTRVRPLSYEVVYKEIYGYIFGKADPADPARITSREEYAAARSGTLTPQESEAVYRIARAYAEHLAANGLTDNNAMSRDMLRSRGSLPYYSLAVLDEVQDLTEINLLFMKSIARKMFCVGDALQMINPSYFSFAYLKRLMYSSETTTIRVLENNYRNTPRIAEIVERLNDLNISRFGTHNFVLRSRPVDSATETSAVYVRGDALVKMMAERKLDNYTLIVSSDEVKKRLRKAVGNREILTVSEVKGLERDTVVLYDLLSDHKDKWAALAGAGVDRKNADENSVYRYYFNLFYVGVSRAKAHVYVCERDKIPFFDKFFATEFACLTPAEALSRLDKILARTETDDADLCERIEEFMRLGQYANARVALDRLRDDNVRVAYRDRIEVHEEFISHGNYREAGVRFWEKGLYDDAREMFGLSGDKLLGEFMEACLKDDGRALDYDIVRYFTDVGNNDVAHKLILSTVSRDLEEIRKTQSSLNAAFKALRRSKEKKHGQ